LILFVLLVICDRLCSQINDDGESKPMKQKPILVVAHQQHSLCVTLLCLWHNTDSKEGGEDASCGYDCGSQGGRDGTKTA